jgi:hypothetical protein
MKNLLSLLVLTTSALLAQLTIPPGSTVIDGSKTPDLIPDVTAMRIFFGAFGKPGTSTPLTTSASSSAVSTASEILTPLQQAKLSRLKFQTTDKAVLVSALLDWYNAMEANGTGNTDRDALSKPVFDKLQQQMSGAGWSALYEYIQSEKKKMTIVVVTTPMQH